MIASEEDANVRRAVSLLAAGEVVGLPTETVYGLAADGTSEAAVRRMFEIKGRPAGHPVILHVASAEDLDLYAQSIPEQAGQLVRAFWPGPLTLVLSRSDRVPDAVTGGLTTVGLRMPAHPLFLSVLRLLGRPLAAPSANRFGRVSPTSAEHVRADLGARVPFVLDGGPCAVGVESTIVDLTGPRPRLRRPGGISIEDMWDKAGVEVETDDGKGPAVPGSLASHYAPRAEVRLVPAADLWTLARSESAARKVGVLARGSEAGPDKTPRDLPAQVFVEHLGETAEEQARELYAALRRLDERGADLVLAVVPPPGGLGTAIADRLQRAAGKGG